MVWVTRNELSSNVMVLRVFGGSVYLGFWVFLVESILIGWLTAFLGSQHDGDAGDLKSAMARHLSCTYMYLAEHVGVFGMCRRVCLPPSGHS